MSFSERSQLNTPHDLHTSHGTSQEKVNLVSWLHFALSGSVYIQCCLCLFLGWGSWKESKRNSNRSKLGYNRLNAERARSERRWCGAGTLSTQLLPAMLAWLVPRVWRISCSSLTARAASSPQHKSGSRTTSRRPTPTKERWVNLAWELGNLGKTWH